MEIKYEGIDYEIWKSMIVVKGYKDRMIQSLVHETAVSRKYSTNGFLGIALIFGFKIFSTDDTQSYLQSTEDM